MCLIERNNVRVRGSGSKAMVFAHGFGCDQNMRRFVEPAFEQDFRTVLFDQVGAGGSDLASYDKAKYSTFGGYADDVVEIGRELGLGCRGQVVRRLALGHSTKNVGGRPHVGLRATCV